MKGLPSLSTLLKQLDRINPVPGALPTPRQVQIGQLLADGLEFKAIGVKLGITEKTISVTLDVAYKRVGVHNAAGFVGWCFRKGLIK